MKILELWNGVAQASCLIMAVVLMWLLVDAVGNRIRRKRKPEQDDKWFLKNVLWVGGMPFKRQYRCELRGRNHILVSAEDERGWEWCFEPAWSSDLLPYCPGRTFVYYEAAMKDALEWWDRTGGDGEVA